MGARQLVVQEALETTFMSLVYFSWFTPQTNMGASAEGAEMMTCTKGTCEKTVENTFIICLEILRKFFIM